MAVVSYIKMNSIEALLECIAANGQQNFPAVWAMLCGPLQARFLRRAALVVTIIPYS